MEQLSNIDKNLVSLRKALTTHVLYDKLQTLEDVRVFMEYHVYPVWDFMSLLKGLQLRLTGMELPWIPAPNPMVSRFVNEIVLAEESDINELGEPKSHFEMYLDAMSELGADRSSIDTFIAGIRKGHSVAQMIDELSLDPAIANFLTVTFNIVDGGEPHQIASAFTFGREEVIPDMFLEIVRQSEKQTDKSFDKLTYYLQRHIELDGDEHGPLAMKMIGLLCGDDEQKWDEVLETAKEALEARLALWDAIAEKM